MMRALGLALAAIVSIPATAAQADIWEYGEYECDQLWFARNLIMDRAGYCFGSALGPALFDNSDCSGSDIRLDKAAAEQVDRIAALEGEIGCKIDTTRRTLQTGGHEALRRLRDMPLPDNGASACTWTGGRVAFYDGYGPDRREIGWLHPGNRLEFSWVGPDDWTVIFVAKSLDGGEGFLGWVDYSSVEWEANCTEWAG